MKDTDQVKQRIKEEIEATRELVLKYRELTKPIAPENAIGRVSRMDAINNKSVNDAALQKAEIKFKNLEVALSKVNDPDFGICIQCKNEIPLGRIMLLPHTVSCVNCAR